jgi:hypothetical protein
VGQPFGAAGLPPGGELHATLAILSPVSVHRKALRKLVGTFASAAGLSASTPVLT